VPNLYATPTEVQAAMPDEDFSSDTTYNAMLYALINRISRLVDNFCNRVFYPYLDTRYFEGAGELLMLRDDLYSITSASYSTDYGVTFTDLTENTDFVGQVSNSLNSKQSYNALRIVPSSGAALGAWPTGFKAVKVIGTWGFVQDRNGGWEDTGDALGTALGTSASSVTVSDVDGADKWGISPRIEAGKLLKIDSEFMEAISTNTGSNTASVVRAVNGTTAVSHNSAAEVDIWRPPEVVKQAVIAEATRIWGRQSQGYADARATVEVGQFSYVKSLDPLTQLALASVRRIPMA
jgi:hypothetical protein